jgi:hypothetical protein
MKLWIFGNSMCTAYKLSEHQGWPFLLANDLDVDYQNYAQPAVDNFYIYQSFLSKLKDIKDNDIVVIGWSHPSRKTFTLDRQNKSHVDILPYSLHYICNNREFIRSDVGNIESRVNSLAKWAAMSPYNSDIAFYDNWFNTYYSEYEQNCNFQSYVDSVKLRCPGKYIPFWFSKESTKNINCNTGGGYILDFVIENSVEIDSTDLHLNETGHMLWTKHLKYLIE